MQLRLNNLRQLEQQTFDVLIVGGGINGAVSAASLAAKGARVALIDQGDFAGASSSHSSNLAWGGIKYMENFEFLLVNKLSKSRNTLAEAYPSTVQEIRFLTTINRGFRFPAFLVFLGSLLYWLIGRFKTRPPKYMTRKRIKALESRIDVSRCGGWFGVLGLLSVRQRRALCFQLCTQRDELRRYCCELCRTYPGETPQRPVGGHGERRNRWPSD